jgi:hypothetical protein
MRVSKIQWILFAACFLLYPLAASAAPSDADHFWTTVGSAGTLDETSSDQVFFDRAVVQMGKPVLVGKSVRPLQPEATSGADVPNTAVIRYNVTAVDGLFGVSGARLAVRFLDEAATVTAQLVEVDVATGAKVTLLTFNSDNYPAQSGYHMYDVCGGFKAPFDFVRKAYYIEATLTTSSIIVGSAAGIEAIQLNATPCP